MILASSLSSQLNPQHCIPTLVDHKNGLVLWESRAILAYLVNQYSAGHALYPSDAKERALVDRALYFEAGTLYPAQAAAFYAQFFGKPIEEEKRKVYHEKLDILDKTIGDQKYLTGGEKSLADLSLLPTLVAAETLGADLSPHKNVTRWLSGLKGEGKYARDLQDMVDGLKAFVASAKK